MISGLVISSNNSSGWDGGDGTALVQKACSVIKLPLERLFKVKSAGKLKRPTVIFSNRLSVDMDLAGFNAEDERVYLLGGRLT